MMAFMPSIAGLGLGFREGHYDLYVVGLGRLSPTWQAPQFSLDFFFWCEWGRSDA